MSSAMQCLLISEITIQYTCGSQPVVRRPLVVHDHLPGGPRAKAIFYILRILIHKQTNFIISIFSGGPHPRDKICKWSPRVSEG